MFGSLLGNILGTLYFFYFQIAGIFIISFLLRRERPLTNLLLGSCLGSLLLQWLPILFAFFFDFTLLSHILALLILLPVFAIAVYNRRIVFKRFCACPGDMRYHLGFLLALTGTMVLWIYLLHTHTIPVSENGAMYAGQCTYGDMNMHLGFITSIANQGTFPPDYSLFPGTRLSYPFLSDSISSSIYLMGASLRCAYILPMLAAFAQIVGSVYLLGITLFKSRAKAMLTYVLYFFNGGLGFFYFVDWAREREFTFSDIFTGFYTTPTNLVDYNIRWTNVIADMFLPQRATLFGYAILFPCIWLLHQAVFREKKKYFLIAGIFASALPMIHTHSFLSIGLISAAWLLIYLYRAVTLEQTKKWIGGRILCIFIVLMCLFEILTKKQLVQSQDLLIFGILGLGCCVVYGIYLLIQYLRKNGLKEITSTWGMYLLCVLVLAIPQLLFWTFGQVAEGGFLRGHFNWGNQGDFYPWFYLKNLGVPLILIIGAVCTGRKKSKHLLLPALVIWFLAEFIVFTPNVYDNNKLLYAAYLLLCLAAADYAVEVYKQLQNIGGARWFAGLFLFFSMLSAVLTLGREAVSEYELYPADHVELAQYVEENTPADAVFLTHTHHNNELPSLTGRSIVCGADTFLYFHGIDTTQRKQHVQLMYESPMDNMDLYDLYNVSYVVVSSWERSSYALNENFFAENFELVFSNTGINLYKVK